MPDGKRYVTAEPLLARRAPQVQWTSTRRSGSVCGGGRYGVNFVYHGGDVVGYRSGMELLFDGRPEADAWISEMAKSSYADLAEERKLVILPADVADAAKLAPRYASDDLGEISVRRDDNGAKRTRMPPGERAPPPVALPGLAHAVNLP